MFVDFERAKSEVFKTEILYLYLNLTYVLAHKPKFKTCGIIWKI